MFQIVTYVVGIAPDKVATIRAAHARFLGDGPYPASTMGGVTGLVQHDIAILELAGDIEGVAPAALPATPDAASRLSSGSLVALVGYGATDEDGTNEGIKNVGVASIVGFTAEEVVIGAPSVVRNCTGDSGGPSIAYTSPRRPWLLGITSRSLIDDAPCAGSAVHTRVDAHLRWIERVLAELDEPPDGCRVARSPRPSPATWLLILLGVAVVRRLISLNRLQNEGPKMDVRLLHRDD